MNKYINIRVSATISTDFFIEVPESTSEEKILDLAKKEVILPHKYPEVLDNILQTRMGIKVTGIDSMLKAWNIDKLDYNFNKEELNELDKV